MVPLRIAAGLFIGALAITSAFSRNQELQAFSAQDSPAAAKSLFSQSAVLVLEREFPGSDISYLLFDSRSRTLFSSLFSHPATPTPLYPLLHPFPPLPTRHTHDTRL